MARRAARVLDHHICPLAVPSTHIGGPILPAGARTVVINGLSAARVADRALCVAPAPDTVRGGLLSLFIEGNPAARIFDDTDVGKIVTGSANVLLGEWKGGALSRHQAQWLYDYMAAQEHIPFEYATDGCFARADRMAQYIQSLGIDVSKQWVAMTPESGPLNVRIDGYPSNGVTWGWHVAPTVPVSQRRGPPRQMVIDPSLGPGRPITVEQWIARQSQRPDATARVSTAPEWYFNPYQADDGTWASDIDQTAPDGVRSDPEKTADDLDRYRERRAGLPESSGRRMANASVHY